MAHLTPSAAASRDSLLAFIAADIGADQLAEALADPEIRELVDALCAEPLEDEPPAELVATWIAGATRTPTGA